MANNPALEDLVEREQVALKAKESARQKWHAAKKAAEQVRKDKQAAWQAKRAAEELLNYEYENMHQDKDEHDKIWDAYGEIRNRNNAKINSLIDKANHERERMKYYFDLASRSYHGNNRFKAPYYSQKGYEHRTRYYKLKDEIHDLGEEVKKARREAEQKAPLVSRETYEAARKDFLAANEDYLEKSRRFDKLNQECLRLKKIFLSKARRHLDAKKALLQKQQEIESAKREIDAEIYNQLNLALMSSGAHHAKAIEESDAKIIERKREPGIYDVYFLGLGPSGDGEGHGHAVINANGTIVYLRDAWSNHNDYLIDTRREQAG